MTMSDYLRRQADNCLRLARTGFDLATAERLRHMAADLRSKADELDDDDNSQMAPHIIDGNGTDPGSSMNGSGENNSGGELR